MVKTEIYYQVVKPDYDEWGRERYQHATISIFEVTPEERERYDRYYPGAGYIDDSSLVFRLSYQRDRTRDRDGNETFDTDKAVVSRWYAEDIDHIKHSLGIDIDKIENTAKILRKMEKTLKKIWDKGLSVSEGDDHLKLRIFLLNEIGAREIYYNREKHGFFTGMVTA